MPTGGASGVEPTFNDFFRLTRFTHLETAYAGRAWVRVDGDKAGRDVVQKLRDRFPTWPEDRFGTFSHEQFEHYYPRDFADRASAVLSVSEKKQKREEKRELLLAVCQWLDADGARARQALAESAADVIADLQTIEKQLLS